jgi:hypothetical protein
MKKIETLFIHLIINQKECVATVSDTDVLNSVEQLDKDEGFK